MSNIENPLRLPAIFMKFRGPQALSNRPGGLSHCGGLEILEDFEGAKVEAISGINAPLDAVKSIECVLVGLPEGSGVLEGFVLELGAGELFVQAFEAIIPKVSFDTAEAALRPLGVEPRQLPLTPARVWQLINDASQPGASVAT